MLDATVVARFQVPEFPEEELSRRYPVIPLSTSIGTVQVTRTPPAIAVAVTSKGAEAKPPAALASCGCGAKNDSKSEAMSNTRTRMVLIY
jgi:hypothetical protein